MQKSCTKIMTVKPKWKITEWINAQVTWDTYPLGIVLLSISRKRKNSALITKTHWQCSQIPEKKCQKGHFFVTSRNSLLDGHMLTLFYIMTHLQWKSVENHVSGDKPEILQKTTYAQIMTDNWIRNTYGSWWSKSGSKEQNSSKGLLKLFKNLKNTKGLVSQSL